MNTFINIKYWPLERVYPTPNRLRVLAPDTWGVMKRNVRIAWVKRRLSRELPGSEYLGFTVD